MVLNTKSFGHVKVRYLCFKVSQITGLKLETNLSSNFKKIVFKNELSYLILDYKKEAIVKMSVNLTPVLYDMVEEIIISLNFFEMGMMLKRRRNKYGNIKK